MTAWAAAKGTIRSTAGRAMTTLVGDAGDDVAFGGEGDDSL